MQDHAVLKESRAKEDFTLAQYNAIRQYHHRFVTPSAYTGYYETPAAHHNMESLLTKNLCILPNLRYMRFARPPIMRTPFYHERYSY
jgi:hypothetical protein